MSAFGGFALRHLQRTHLESSLQRPRVPWLQDLVVDMTEVMALDLQKIAVLLQDHMKTHPTCK